MFLRLFIIFTLVSCGYWEKDNEPQETIPHDDLINLENRLDYYLSQDGGSDEYGFNNENCDSLMLTALQNAAGGDVDIFQARDGDGRWWRRPQRDCLSNQIFNRDNPTLPKKSPSSKSSISRDMLIGVMLACWANKDFDCIDDMIIYGEDHKVLLGWEYGEHDGSIDGKNRVIVTPALMATMRDMRHALEGSDKRDSTPQIWSNLEGYQSHLQALHILIRGLIDHGVSQKMLDVIKHSIDKDPTNALYHAIYHKFVDGNQSEAFDLLFAHFGDELPSSATQCGSYRYMHGNPKDWEPCPKEKHIHRGTDHNIVAALILGRLDGASAGMNFTGLK